MFSSSFIKPLEKNCPIFLFYVIWFLKKNGTRMKQIRYRENAENTAFYFLSKHFYLVIII
jgi:hypothetical protein